MRMVLSNRWNVIMNTAQDSADDLNNTRDITLIAVLYNQNNINTNNRK